MRSRIVIFTTLIILLSFVGSLAGAQYETW
jgi:hypothetical protein